MYVRKRLDAKQAAKKLHDKSPCEHPFEKDVILYKNSVHVTLNSSRVGENSKNLATFDCE